MDHTTTQTDKAQVETAKGGGCCGGHKSRTDSEVQPISQPSAQKAPVAKSGGCCCSK
jgi:hypothetical protein